MTPAFNLASLRLCGDKSWADRYHPEKLPSLLFHFYINIIHRFQVIIPDHTSYRQCISIVSVADIIKIGRSRYTVIRRPCEKIGTRRDAADILQEAATLRLGEPDRYLEWRRHVLARQGDATLKSGVPTGESVIAALGPAVSVTRNMREPNAQDEVQERREEALLGDDDPAQKKLVVVYEVNVVNFHFPPSLDTANLERASQSLLRDKAIAERERVSAEAETMQVRKQLAQQEAEVATVKIERIGEALAKNPLYPQYDLQLKLPEIYEKAGQRGNLVLVAPSPLNLGWGQGLPGQLPRPSNAEPSAPPPAPKAVPPPKVAPPAKGR